MSKITKDNIKSTIITIIVIISIVAVIGGLVHHGNQYTEHEYQLYEIDKDVYAIYYITHSRVPAHNYEVITVCCDGNMYTFQGNVNISFVDDTPCVKVRNYNIVNSDDIYVYVPRGTVVYQPSVDISR